MNPTVPAFERTLDRVFATPPTPAERRVLEPWIVEGLHQSEIAELLVLSPKSVDSLLASAVRRTHLWAKNVDRPRRRFERLLLMTYALELHREGALA